MLKFDVNSVLFNTTLMQFFDSFKTENCLDSSFLRAFITSPINNIEVLFQLGPMKYRYFYKLNLARHD